MSTPTIPPPRRRRKGSRPVADPRPAWRCACHAPLPPDTWDNRRARLVVRRRRCSAASRHLWRDFYYLARELEVWLPFLHPRTVRQWRDVIGAWRWGAEVDLKQVCRLEATILRYEPETDAWLRRRLGELEVRR